MYKNIESGELKLPLSLSEEVKDLMMKLLERDPSKRLGGGKDDANEIKPHPWFSCIDWNVAMERGLNVPKPPAKKIPKGHINIDVFGNTNQEENSVNGWNYASKSIV